MKSKSLYQVKLLLENLPQSEYNLIPQEDIDYIKSNCEYDEKFKIDSNISIKNQKLDTEAQEILEKIMKKVEEKKRKNQEITQYIKNVKEANKHFNTTMENIILKKHMELFKKENSKIPEVKKLLEEYQQLVNQKNEEIADLKEKNKYLYSLILKFPKILRKIFIKDSNTKLLK